MCIPLNWGPNNSDYYPKEEKEKDRDKRCPICAHKILYKGITHVFCTNENCENYPVVYLDKIKEEKPPEEIEEIELD